MAEAHEPPLSLRRQILGIRYALKVRQHRCHPTYPYVFSEDVLSTFDGGSPRSMPFGQRLRDLGERSGIVVRNVMRVDPMPSPPWRLIRSDIDLSLADAKKTEMTSVEYRSRALELLTSYEGCVLTFTDGSKSSEGAGCASVSNGATRSFSFPSDASVFTTELVAILKALCFIEVYDEALHLILSYP